MSIKQKRLVAHVPVAFGLFFFRVFCVNQAKAPRCSCRGSLWAVFFFRVFNYFCACSYFITREQKRFVVITSVCAIVILLLCVQLLFCFCV